MFLTKKLDNFLNGITMYRLLLYGLGILSAVAMVLAFAGVLSLSGTDMLISLSVLSITCFAANKLFGWLYKAPINGESSLITALILFFILPPGHTFVYMLSVGMAGLVAMASKFVLAFRHKHIFNPAAVTAVILGLVGVLNAAWWVASDVMLPFTIILGALIVRKIRRFDLLVAFLVAALTMLLIMGQQQNQAALEVLKEAFTSWPVVFFGTIMLTEPLTSPPTRNKRIMYGLLAGTLFGAQKSFAGVATTPEVSLVLANTFSFLMSTKRRFNLVLQQKIQLAPRVYDFVFKPDSPLRFKAGQYMEWTLPHVKLDSRGNRRTFTIASSPTEDMVHLGIKLYEPSSTFKQTLVNMSPGDSIATGQITGDFTLPSDTAVPLVFIAGGIGVTPFRSIIKNLIDKQEKRDIILFYVVSDPAELVYKDVLSESQKHGVIIKPIVNTAKHPAKLTEVDIKQLPRYQSRLYYLSGPQGMVKAYEQMLRAAGVKSKSIVTDYFPGY